MKHTIISISETYKKYQNISSYTYILALILIPIGLLFSRAILSIGFLLFILNWFLEGQFKQKWLLIKQKKAEMIISLIFVIHLAGIIHTQNLDDGLFDLKIKLPLLLPVFFGSSEKLLKIFNSTFFILLFAFSTLVASLAGFINFQYILEFQTVDDLRNITWMGQNIMLSLFVNFAIFILIKQLYNNWHKNRIYIKLFLLSCIIWLIIFLYLLNSLTGHITFIFLVFYSLIYLLKVYENKKMAVLSIIAVGITALIISIHIKNVVSDFYKIEKTDLKNLDKNTQNGNLYQHHIESNRTENGYYIDIYICMNELEKEWGKVSSFTLSGKDLKGQILSETLFRYLTSKGLRKDSAGLKQLSKNEIAFIENGCANYKYINKYSLEARIYNIVWQLDTYKKTGNPNAQSISQRIEFLKSAQIIIKENFWFGVGSGDVMDTFHQTLEKASPNLNEKFRNRVHNQYIVEFTALGIFGFVMFIFTILFPVFYFKIWNNYLFSIFYLIILISFLTDNPFETQLGIGFFAYFYCLFVFKSSNKNLHLNQII